MKPVLAVFLSFVVLSACGGGSARLGTPVTLPPGPITIQNTVPFIPGNHIANNIKQECDLNSQLSVFIKEYATENAVELRGVDALDTSEPGNVLKIEITHSVSQGNAFIGHRKYTAVRGELYDNGKLLASFTGARNSGGGAFAGFKGSCAVLGRTVKALGKDIATWLKQPSNNAHLGD